jgi:hypothetical protein
MPFFWADAERQAIRMKAKSRFVVFIGINPAKYRADCQGIKAAKALFCAGRLTEVTEL